MTKTLKGVDAQVQEPAAAGGNVDYESLPS